MNRLNIVASFVLIFSAQQIFSSHQRQLTGLPAHVQERCDYDNGAYLLIFTAEHENQTGVVLQMHENDGTIINYYPNGKAEKVTQVQTSAQAAPSDDRPDVGDFDYKK